MNKKMAIEIALPEIINISDHSENELDIEIKEITSPHGWLFYYQSKKFLESKDPRDALFSNVPIFIESRSKKVYLIANTAPVEWQLEALRKSGQIDLQAIFEQYRAYVEDGVQPNSGLPKLQEA